MALKHFLLWLPMIALAFANATLRELVLVNHFNPLQAHQLSTITLIALCAVYVCSVSGVLAFQDARQAWLTGLAWMLLTVAFEFTLGRLMHKPWSVLFTDYHVLAGRIWPLFLVCLMILPYLCWKPRH